MKQLFSNHNYNSYHNTKHTSMLPHANKSAGKFTTDDSILETRGMQARKKKLMPISSREFEV
jgi:hypothetical protein